MGFRAVSSRIGIAATAMLIAGLLGGLLLRVAPGAEFDGQELNPQFSDELQRNRLAAARSERDIPRFYARYLSSMAHGDLGWSRSLNRPVAELLKERVPATAAAISSGLLVGGAFGLLLSVGAAATRSRFPRLAGSTVSVLAVSLPTAVVGLLCLWTDTGVRAALALCVFPHVYRYSSEVLRAAAASPCVLAAKARGIGPARILGAYIVLPEARSLMGLAGASFAIAFGAAVPLEVFCDAPGVGSLAWQATSARDMPLLVAITMLVTAATLTVNMAGDLATWILAPRSHAV